MYQSNINSNYVWCNIVEDDAILVTTDKSITKINTDGAIKTVYEVKKNRGAIVTCNKTTNGVFLYQSNGTVLKYQNHTIFTYPIKNIKDSSIRSFISHNNKVFGLKTNGDLVTISDTLVQQYKSISKERPYYINYKTNIGLGVQKGARYYYNSTNDTVKTSPVFFKKYFLSAFSKSKKNTLLFGTFGNGIIVVPNYKVTKVKRDYLFLDIATTPTNKVALSTRSGEIFTYQNNTLTQIDKVTNNVDNIFYFPNFQFYTKNEFVYNDIEKYNLGIKDAIAINKKELLFASSQGVMIFKKSKKLKNNNIDERITSKRCNTIAWSKKDTTIYFTSNEGVFKTSRNSPKITEILAHNNSFLANDLTAINQELICGSLTKGVLIFKKDTLIFQLSKKDGLFSNRVRQVTLKEQLLYILTNKGVQVYDRSANKFLDLGVNTSVISNNIIQFALSDDTLWLLEKNGFSSIKINTITAKKEEKPISKLYIDSLLVNDIKIDYLKEHQFTYNENKLSIFFDYRNIETKTETEIAYILKGYHKEWKTKTTTQNNIEFHSLPVGNYTFKIKATYRNQETETFSYTFKITPPFWLAWWFYVLLALLLLLLLVLIFLRFKRLKIKNAALLEKQQLKTHLLDSELKALRSQMNPHFIFNALNSIQGLILQKDTNASYDYIVLFASLVRNTLNYSSKDFISIHKELAFLEVYLKLEKLRFGDDFTYSIEYKGDKEIKVPSLIIQPFIENALLHGLLHRKGDKKLSIVFEFTNQLKCTIIDNGVGRVKSTEIQERQGKRHESFALRAIKKRLEILSMKSATKAHFTTTDLYDYDIPKGTKIEIILPFKTVF